VITFGTYDLFHYGHLRILERSAAKGDRLVVGVSSDALNWSKKQKVPAIPDTQRMAIVAALDCVDEVFLEESLELKKEYCQQYGADVLVMGDDHLNEYNEMLEGICECEYLARTDGVSSTMLKEKIALGDSGQQAGPAPPAQVAGPTPCSVETTGEESLVKEGGRTVLTFGTYDLFHYGHLRIIERSAARGDRLVVGVSSDALNWSKKQKVPAIPDWQRMAIVKALKCVDEVFSEESLELKKEYCLTYGADVLVMGDDHLNEYNEMLEGVCECEYLARTDGVSSTMLKEKIALGDSGQQALADSPSSDSLVSMDSKESVDDVTVRSIQKHVSLDSDYQGMSGSVADSDYGISPSPSNDDFQRETVQC